MYKNNIMEEQQRPRILEDNPKLKKLLERAMYLFEQKLKNCNYTEEDIEKIIKESQKHLSEDIRKRGFGILWSIETEYTKSLRDVFQKEHLEIEPLGFYVLEVDFYRQEILISEKHGVRPKVA